MISHTLNQMERDIVALITWGGGMNIAAVRTKTKGLVIANRNVTRIQSVKVIRSVPKSPDVISTLLLLALHNAQNETMEILETLSIEMMMENQDVLGRLQAKNPRPKLKHNPDQNPRKPQTQDQIKHLYVSVITTLRLSQKSSYALMKIMLLKIFR